MVRPASRESNFGISTSYEAFANREMMAAKEQVVFDILSPNGNCSSPGLNLLCCLVTTSSIMRSTWVSKETQQRSLFDLFQRAMGAKDQFFKPRMATDFDKARSIKTAVISFPHEDTPPGHGLRQPVFHHQRNRGTLSSKGKVYH